MKTYTFAVTLLTTIQVQADSISAARMAIDSAVNGASANLGAWRDGSPIVAEVSIEGDLDLEDIA